ncbi:MAG: TatD family hydrolase [bacterium]|nr:TatD family hydrolase [bacterium]
MQYNYFDIHSHLNFDKYDEDREQVIKQLQDENIATITVGTGLETSQEAVGLADKYENLFATIGVHPADEPTESSFNELEFEKLVSNKKVVAIGECGLDYTRLENPEQEKARQKNLFEQQIEFAVKYNKSLMIHCRDAYEDCISILKSKQQQYGERVRGNFHFFTSPVEVAKQCLNIGFTVSFTGPITFVPEYSEIVKYVPLERIMTETDAPFASPVPHRGKRNNPLYVKEIVAKIAEIKGLDLEMVKKQLILTTFETFFKENLTA